MPTPDGRTVVGMKKGGIRTMVEMEREGVRIGDADQLNDCWIIESKETGD